MAAEVFKDNMLQYCKDKGKLDTLKTKYEKDENESKLKYPGSTISCQNLSKNTIANFYQGTQRNTDYKWEELIVLSCEKECEALAKKSQVPPGTASDSIRAASADNDEAQKLDKCFKSKIPQAKRCEAIAYHTARARRKWSEPAHAKNDVKEFKAIGIKCSNSGVETIDFESCVEFAENFENFEAVQGVAYQGQGLVYQSKLMDAQAKVAEEKDAAKGALKGTKESIELQQNMYQQRSAIDTAKLAMLYNNYKDIPDKETVVANCKGFQNSYSGVLGELTDTECVEFVNGSTSRFEVLQNQAMKDKMKAKMIKVAGDAGSNMILASLLGKRADDIDKALAKVDEFKPIDPFIVSEEDMQTTFCKQNPGDPNCLAGGLDRTVDGISDNIITFGEGGTGTTYGNPYNNETNAIANGTEAAKKNKTIDSMGSAVTGLGRNNSIEGSSGASVKTGGAGGAPGGGGGGAAGGGASGGGGGGAAPGQAQAGNQSPPVGKAVAYDGGSGSLSMMGGFGINKAKGQAKEEGNPFGKLFDKDGAKKDGVVNFRDLASVGKKGDNLFDMISKRYSTVNADKRLLEYELAK